MAGTVLTSPAAGGYGSTVEISSTTDFGASGLIEMYGSAPTPGFDGVSLSAPAINRVTVGGLISARRETELSERLAAFFEIDRGRRA